jgi:outer membrane protein TolC
MALDTTLERAQSNRQDLQASVAALRAAEDALKAAHAERLPNLTVAADYGVAGLRPSTDADSVWTVSGTLTIPIWEGGRIRGDIDQATAVFRQRQAELEDLRGQVYQDVRQAFIDLNSAADQVEVAKSNLDLAHQTLEQSRDRFSHGVADSVELVQAEQTVVQADDDYITAVYEHNLAKVSLSRAMGNAEQSLPQMLRK